MRASTIASVIGAFVVLTGIAILGVQFLEGDGDQPGTYSLIGAEIGSLNLALESSFPGLSLIALGVFLLMVGAIAGR